MAYWKKRGVPSDLFDDMFSVAYVTALRYVPKWTQEKGAKLHTYLTRPAIAETRLFFTRSNCAVSTSDNNHVTHMGRSTHKAVYDGAKDPRTSMPGWDTESPEDLIAARMRQIAQQLQSGELLLKLSLKEIKVGDVAQEGAEQHRLYRKVRAFKERLAKDPVLRAYASGNYGYNPKTNRR